MDSIKFSEHNLIKDDGSVACKKDLRTSSGEYTITDEDGVSGIAIVDNTDDSLWIYARCGRSKPYSEEVLNVKTSEKESNPRSKDQAELRIQNFFYYDYETGLAYISGGLSFFKGLLKQMAPGVKLRNVYKSREAFLASLRKVTKVRLIAKENLFSCNESLFTTPAHSIGLGNPSQMRLDIKFPHVSVTEAFQEFIREKLSNGCKTGVISSLVVAGDCEEGDRLIESTFNLKKIESYVMISAQKDDAGFFDPTCVRQRLFDKIR